MKAESALSSELFLRLDVEAVAHILQRDTLDIDEFALFRRYAEWIDAQSCADSQ
jgi:hypothetical protein